MPAPKKIAQALLKHALSYPETREDHPWGESAVKVKEKTFLFLRAGESVSFSVKLPTSRDFALEFPFTEPTGYGLGKSGWVTVKLEKGDEIELEVLKKWVDESFRAVAPKRLLKSS
jgi:predicted DNA-binding protein (MmcQ/YjbR family)